MRLCKPGNQGHHEWHTLIPMWIVIILLTTTFLQVSAKADSQMVSFSGRRVPLKKIFTTIEKQTRFVFFYDVALIRNTRPIDIELKNLPIETALHKCLAGLSLDFSIQNKTIVISRSAAAVVQRVDKAVNSEATPIEVHARDCRSRYFFDRRVRESDKGVLAA